MAERRARHRTVKAALAACVLAFGLTDCGRAGDPPTGTLGRRMPPPVNAVPNPQAHVISPRGFVKYDGDEDPDDRSTAPSREDEQEMVAAARHGASAANTSAVGTVVKAYLTAAVAENGARGCELLTSALARATGETAATDCAAALTRLFAQQHGYLAAEEPASLVTTGVHVLGDVGFATLGFRRATESELVLHRENHHWRIDALFDSTLP